MRRAFRNRFSRSYRRRAGCGRCLISFRGEYDRFPLVGFPVTQKFAESNPNTVAALQRALAKGLAFAHNNPDKLRDIYPTFTTLQPELARKIVLSYTPEKSDFTQLKKIADLMDRLQMLPGKTQAAGRRNAAIMTRLAGRSAHSGRLRSIETVGRSKSSCIVAATAFRVALGIFVFFLILEFVTSLELVPPHLSAASLDRHRAAWSSCCRTRNFSSMSWQRFMPGPSASPSRR